MWRRTFVVLTLLLLVVPSGGARNAGAQADPFATLVAAAKAEGSVVVDGPPLDPFATL